MKYLALNVSDLVEKVKSARNDVQDLGSLRKIAVPVDGTSFLIEKALYVFVAGDRSEDDGTSSVKPESVSASKPGRYRRGALSLRQKA